RETTRYRSETSLALQKGKLSLLDGGRCVSQRFPNVLALEVGIRLQDGTFTHPVGHQSDHCRHRYPWPAHARDAPPLPRIDRDSKKLHRRHLVGDLLSVHYAPEGAMCDVTARWPEVNRSKLALTAAGFSARRQLSPWPVPPARGRSCRGRCQPRRVTRARR